MATVAALGVGEMRMELIPFGLTHLRFDRLRVDLREGHVHCSVDAVAVQGSGRFRCTDGQPTGEKVVPHFDVRRSQLARRHRHNSSHYKQDVRFQVLFDGRVFPHV